MRKKLDGKIISKKANLNSVTYIICSLTLLGVVLLTIATSIKVETFLRKELQLRISDVVQIMVEKIDGDLHNQIQSINDENGTIFTTLKNTLVRMREHSTDIANIYTMRKVENGDVYIIVDGSAKNQNTVGTLYPHPSETLLLALNATPDNAKIYTEPEIYVDEWGTWLSSYAPIFTSTGKLDGILGIDVSAESIQQHRLEFIGTISIVSFLVLLFILPFMLHFMNAIKTIIKEREQANKWNRTILNNLGDGIYTLDSSGNLTYLNNEAEKMLGWTFEELKGKPIHPIIHYQKPDGSHLPFEECPISLSMKNNDVYRSDNEVFFHKDGSRIQISMVGAPLLDHNTLIGSVACFRDVSQQKSIKAQLLKAKENAEQISRLKSEFLSTMSHEIRTPMNGIIGMTDLLFDTPLNEEQLEFANIIKSSSQALLTIINDILDFSKIEAGQLTIESTEFSLQNVLEGSADVLATKAYEKSLSLMTFIDPVLPERVIGDPTRLRQILLNFLSNAVKFTAKGSVHLNATLVEKIDNKIRMRIEILDSGIGISLETKARLFRPFSQADSSTTRKYGGTGLGLSISKRLTELMGGEIGLNSVLGEGSTFWIELPFQIGTQNPHFSIEKLRGKRVLVVGKNTGHHDIYLAYLCAWGILVNTTDNIDEMLYILEEAQSLNQDYDAVLFAELSVDEILIMLDQIHEKTTFQHLPMIACQEFIDTNLKRQLIDKGIASVLVKPVKQSSLFDAMVKILHPEESKQLEHLARPAVNESYSALQHEQLILLVEDNLVNQQVAKHILHKLGYTLHIVNNGKEAVDSLETLPYALVLMDCQMPIMDGFEATYHIRKREQESNLRKHIPIIAMTANAIEGDRENCLAAGMDDYVSKPIDVNKLAHVLKKWLPEIKEKPVTVSKTESKTVENCPIEIRHLSEMFDDDREVVTELLGLFYDSLAPLKVKLVTAVEEKKSNVKAIAHEIKGSAHNVGAVILAKFAEQLEHASVEQNWAEIENLTTQIQIELNRVAHFIEQYIQK